MIGLDFVPFDGKLMHLQQVLEIQQSEIKLLNERLGIHKRQINTLFWACGILASFYFVTAIILIG